MARIPLVDARTRPDLAEAIAHVSGARGGRLINVYRLLLNSPEIALAWVEFNSAVRLKSGVEPRLREMVIVRIAILTRTEYVYRAHVPRYAHDAGLTDSQIEALWSWQTAAAFDDRERAVLAYTDAMTQNVQVPDELFEPLRRWFDERQIVELTVLAGAYSMQCRVLEALRIDSEPAWDTQAAHWR